MNRFTQAFVLCLCLFAWVGVKAEVLGRISTLYIETQDGQPILSRDEWKNCTSFRLVSPGDKTAYQSGGVTIKARGHSTFSKPKKPFVFRLPKEEGLLGMRPGKNWLLLANFMDHSNVRNSLALAIARCTSLRWIAEDRFVDVVVNGKPQGLYLMTKGVEVGDHCVELSPEDYLLEGDDYIGAPDYVRTEWRHLPFHVRNPRQPTVAQISFIREYLNRVEWMLYTDASSSLQTLFEQYLDKRSFADWWLVHELAQNAEPNGPRSCYMYLQKGGKLHAGPVWDFDLAFINVGVDRGGDIRPSRFRLSDVRALTGDSLYDSRALWYDRLLKDAAFKEEVRKRWRQLKPRFERLGEDIDRWDTLIRPSALADERLWKGQDPARFDQFTGYDSSIRHLKTVYLYRIESLDKLIDKLP